MAHIGKIGSSRKLTLIGEDAQAFERFIQQQMKPTRLNPHGLTRKQAEDTCEMYRHHFRRYV